MEDLIGPSVLQYSVDYKSVVGIPRKTCRGSSIVYRALVAHLSSGPDMLDA